jgi:hypothetical protein
MTETFQNIQKGKKHITVDITQTRDLFSFSKEEQQISFESKTIKMLLLDFIKSIMLKEFNKVYNKNNVEFEK